MRGYNVGLLPSALRAGPPTPRRPQQTTSAPSSFSSNSPGKEQPHRRSMDSSPSITTPKQDKSPPTSHHSTPTQCNIFHQIPLKSLPIFLPLWPDETGPVTERLSSTSFTGRKFGVVEGDGDGEGERQHLLVYYKVVYHLPRHLLPQRRKRMGMVE